MKKDLEKKELKLAAKADEVLGTANKLVPRSPDTYLGSVNYLRYIKKAKDEVHEAFDDLVDSAYKHYKEISAKRNSYLKPLEQGSEVLKKRIFEYAQERELESKELQDATNKALKDAGYTDLVVLASEKEGDFILQTRRYWKWRLSDIKKVPRGFLKTDDAKISLNVRALKDCAEIPGIDVYFEDKIIEKF